MAVPERLLAASRRLHLLLGAVILAASTASSSRAQTGEPHPPLRRLGIWPNAQELLGTPATRCDYARDRPGVLHALVARLAESGVGAVTIPVTWRSVDASPGSPPDFSQAGHLLAAFGLGYDVFLNLAPVWTDRLETPADLGTTPFSSTRPAGGGPPPIERTIERGRALIDQLVRQLPDAKERVKFVSLGNEVDLFTVAREHEPGRFVRPRGGATPAWLGFRRMFHELAPYVRERLPAARVTVTFTSDALLSPQGRARAMALWPAADVLAVTYHDGEQRLGRFTQVLERLTRVYRSDLPIVFQEVGFQAPPGAEATQVAFVEEVFRAWADAGARVPYLGFFSLHDWYYEIEPCAPCDPCADGCRACGAANHTDGFAIRHAGFLGTDGSPKLAWERFKELARSARGRP